LITIALQSVLATLREHPNRYNIIFNNNNNNNNNNEDTDITISNEYQESIVSMIQRFARDLLHQAVEQTMATVVESSQTETEAEDTEVEHSIERSTETDAVKAKSENNTEAAASTEATKEEETNGMKN
jgi:hypothetical protein